MKISNRKAEIPERQIIDAYADVYVARIRENISLLNENERFVIVRKLFALLSSGMKVYDEIRVPACKLLVALVPESIDAISQLLQLRRNRNDCEVHFTLFCHLDDLLVDEVLVVRKSAEFVQQIPSIVHTYLLNVDSDVARAAWMAGDLVGDHWPIDESLPILLTVVNDARYVAGRLASIHGLEMIWSRVSEPMHGPIREALKMVARNDRSSEVRSSAVFALKQLTKSPRL